MAGGWAFADAEGTVDTFFEPGQLSAQGRARLLVRCRQGLVVCRVCSSPIGEFDSKAYARTREVDRAMREPCAFHAGCAAELQYDLVREARQAPRYPTRTWPPKDGYPRTRSRGNLRDS
jgi:hypothetical protein